MFRTELKGTNWFILKLYISEPWIIFLFNWLWVFRQYGRNILFWFWARVLKNTYSSVSLSESLGNSSAPPPHFSLFFFTQYNIFENVFLLYLYLEVKILHLVLHFSSFTLAFVFCFLFLFSTRDFLIVLSTVYSRRQLEYKIMYNYVLFIYLATW